MSSPNDVRFIAFYLPQFYPTAENDEWWGPGHTEWNFVANARPLFPDHMQPRLPADLGFYDLRVPETRQAQAELAAINGIYGFCYYHYWHNGRRLLSRPFETVLRSGEPDFPFCLSWANHSWAKPCGSYSKILSYQTYSPEDHLRHIRWLCEVFSDPRYIRVAGRPLFLVHWAHHIPDVAQVLDLWRSEASRLGVGDLYLCRVEFTSKDRGDPILAGFDAAVEWQPDGANLPLPNLSAIGGSRRKRREVARFLASLNASVFSYSDLISKAVAKPRPQHKRYPCLTPAWDNSPRRRLEPTIFIDSKPELYARWINLVLSDFEPFSAEENLIFVNAWNEWGESATLEPCQVWGHGFLDVHRKLYQSVE